MTDTGQQGACSGPPARRECVVGVRMTRAERDEVRRLSVLLGTDLSGLLRRPWFPWEATR